MYYEFDEVGRRKLSKQGCLGMNWSNQKEITAWEIAYCIEAYNLPLENVPTVRLEKVQKNCKKIFRGKLIDEKNKRINKRKDKLLETCETLYLDGCKEFNQLDIVKRLLEKNTITEQYKEVNNKFTPRDTKHYNDDKKSYLGHLNKAKESLAKYNSEKDEPGIQIDILIKIGFPEPMTEIEFRNKFLIHNIELQLCNSKISKDASKKLAKQIADYHFPRKKSGN